MKQKQRYDVVNWVTVHEILTELAKEVHDSGFNPDIIIGISRGGLIPLRILSDLLDNTNLAIIGVRFYSNINKTLREPIITQPISIPIENKVILIVDDIADTGESLNLVCKKLLSKAKKIRTLTMYYKPWSCIEPDFYAIQTKAWIVFPWELHETMKGIVNKKMEEGRTLKEVKLDLKKAGFDPLIVERFVIDLWNSKRL